MKKSTTNRGFSIVKFTDSYSEECSVQESSSGEHIWVGISKLKINIGMPWKEIGADEIKDKFNSDNIVAKTRMHLNKNQAKKLIKLLDKFVKTGGI